MKTEDAPGAEQVDPAEFEFKPVPNRKTLRDAGLTLRRKRTGHFRRQAIKRMRAGYEVLG